MQHYNETTWEAIKNEDDKINLLTRKRDEIFSVLVPFRKIEPTLAGPIPKKFEDLINFENLLTRYIEESKNNLMILLQS